MIIVRFQGALGNQICQYAMYQKLKKLYPDQEIKADLSIFAYDIVNPYRMDVAFQHFPLEVATRKEIFQVWHQIPLVGFEKYCTKDGIKTKILRASYHRINKVIMILNKYIAKHRAIEEITIFQNYSDYNKLDERIYKLDTTKNWYIHGTWYNYNLEQEKEEIVELLKFSPLATKDIKNRELLKQIESCESVSIHIRRGNYVTLGYLLIGEKYYQTAVEYIMQKKKAPHFFVFSDDIQYAKTMFQKYDQKMFSFVSGNDGINSYIDLLLMSKCKNNIIANSTFSLTAVLLNREPGITIVPKYWSNGNIETWRNEKWIYI